MIITDIDDVICDASWRKSLLPDWDQYHSSSIDDKPHASVVIMLNALHDQGIKVWAMTGRPEKWRRITNGWFLKHKVRIDNLIMRPDDNRMTSPELKLHFMSMFKKSEGFLILDDRDDVITALRGAGYNVMQIFNQRVPCE